MREVTEGVIGVWMIWIGCVDWRSKRIPVWMIAVLGALSALFRIVIIRGTWKEAMVGMTIGVLLLFISKCTKEAIGYGDGWIILFLGLFLGFLQTLIVVFVAALLTSVGGIIQGILKGYVRNRVLPFVPFLCVSYWAVVLC